MIKKSKSLLAPVEASLKSTFLPLFLISVLVACGDRLHQMIKLVDGTAVFWPARDPNSVPPIEQAYPNITMTILVDGQHLRLTDHFELELTPRITESAGSAMTSKYPSNQLQSAADDSGCNSALKNLGTATRAVFCGNSLAIQHSMQFSLIGPDGRRLTSTSILVNGLDHELGVRHLALSF